MKQLSSDALRIQDDERGVYFVLFAVLLSAVLAVSGFALDGVKLARAELWAQRAADAAAVSGAGRIARDPRVVETLGAATFSRQVADVALHNLFVRNIISSDGTSPPVVTTTDGGNGVRIQVDSAVVSIRVVPGTTRVEASVTFQNEYLIMDLFVKELFTQVEAEAGAQVGTAVVSLLLDTSDSMGRNGKLEDLKDSVSTFLDFFDPELDRINIISFGSDAALIRAFDTSEDGGFDRAGIELSVEGLAAGGATNLTAAMIKAYEQMNALQSLPFDSVQNSLVAYLVFADGGVTAATLDLSSPTALETNTTASGLHEYVSLSGNRAGEALRPFRLIRAPLASTAVRSDQEVPAETVAQCSSVAGDYTWENSLFPCTENLSFRLPGGIRPPGVFPHAQFEEAYQYASIVWSDFLRVFPFRSSAPNLPIGARFYSIGYGAPTPAACINASQPWDNAGGGDCAEWRKDNFLARIANDRERLAQIGRPFPSTGFQTDDFSPGWSLNAAEGDGELRAVFTQAAIHLRLQLLY